MRITGFLACMLIGLILAGCATAPPQPTAYGPAPMEAPRHSLMAGILNAMALPLYIPLKVAVCVTTIVLAAPARAITAITDQEGTESDERDARAVGVEVIVGPETHAAFSPDEKKMWHYHKEEIPKVSANLPDLSAEEAAKVVKGIEETYGKIYLL